MAWIKLTHLAGITYLNTDQIRGFEKSSPTDILVYDNSPTSSVAFTFSSSDEADESINKLEKILHVIDITQLANQIPG